MNEWVAIFEKYKLPIVFGLGGVILLGVGMIFLRSFSETPKVEIISSSPPETATIFADIQGAVQKPGVYELPANSRVNDLLIRAGGLAAEADREWISKNINLAQKLTDGIKIYIPSQKEIRQFGGLGLSTTAGTSGQVAGVSGSVAGKININTATSAQLESLWGIGEKRAADIIAHRPYQTIEELLTKAKIPKNVFEAIKDKISTY